MEEVVVKAIRNHKVESERKYDDYESALSYAIVKKNNGYTVMLLRRVDNKEWVRVMLYPKD